MKCYPAILTGDINKAQEQLALATAFEGCDVAHVDLIDGFYVDNFTITPADLATCECGELQCDFHIMAIDPEDVVNEIIEHASMLPVRAIIAQVEKMGSEQSYVHAVRRQGWLAGLSLDVDTAIESIDEAIWKELQIVQVMGVQAGEQGQTFIERTLTLVDEIVQLRQRQHLAFELILDGGFKPELITPFAARHIDSCTVGSLLWNNAEPATIWKELSS